MPLFSRQRARTRRVSAEKTRTPDAGDGRGRTPLKGLGIPALVALLFAALLVFVMISGRPPLKYYVNDKPAADVRARVRFQFVDEMKTQEQRQKARQNAPPVYRFDASWIEGAQRGLKRLLDDLAAAEDPKSRLDDVARELPIPAEELPALLADLKRGEERSVIMTQVDDTLKRLLRRGVVERRPAVEPGAKIIAASPNGARAEQPVDDVVPLDDVDRILDTYFVKPLGREFQGTARAITGWIEQRAKPTLNHDEELTEQARETAARAVAQQLTFKEAGDLLVARGERIGLRQYDMLVAEQKAFLIEQDALNRWMRVLGVSVLVLTCFGLTGLFLWQHRPVIVRSAVRVSILGALVVVMVLTARLLTQTDLPYPHYLVPIAFASMILAMGYDRWFASAMTVLMVAMVGVATEAGFRPLLVLLAGGLTASLFTRGIRKRTKLLKVGLVTGVVQSITIFGVGLLQAYEPYPLFIQSLLGLANGVGVGVVVTGLLPFLESIFRITTEISLLELGDLNQPVLKSFALRAPGSYNHSLTVGVLAEMAARSIGANDLLVRVGSYFHDIGKINKPSYFIENQSDQSNRHDRLSPQMSALVIIAHVKDGCELGEEMGLPRPIIEFMEQHHGTTRVEYFFKRAQEENGEDSPADEQMFRYPGPKPHTKEAAIVMLADSVESASRSLDDPAPARIEGMVHRIAQTKLADGQLEECNLTLGELHRIEESLTKGLISIFHGRIKY